MKNWMKYIAVLCLLMFVMPVNAAAAESGSGILTAEKNSVSVALNLPEGKTETITSLRLQLRMTVAGGTVGEPVFHFENAIPGTVKDTIVTQEDAGSYLVDVILSGKKDQDIFKGSEYAKIGTLSFEPVSSEYQVQVEIAGDMSEEGEPSVKYVDSGGNEEMLASLDAPSVLVKNEEKAAEPPKNQAIVGESRLKASAKKGKKNIIFEWTKVEGASGYSLCQHNARTQKDSEIALIDNGDVTAFSGTFRYGTSYAFRIRAYKLEADGSRVYGAYSPIVKATVSPAQVKKFAIKRKTGAKTTFSWKKTAKASGYQICIGKKKNGRYTPLKTIQKGKKTTWSASGLKTDRTYYYKVRAYVKSESGKKVYGDYSAAVALRN